MSSSHLFPIAICRARCSRVMTEKITNLSYYNENGVSPGVSVIFPAIVYFFPHVKNWDESFIFRENGKKYEKELINTRENKQQSSCVNSSSSFPKSSVMYGRFMTFSGFQVCRKCSEKTRVFSRISRIFPGPFEMAIMRKPGLVCFVCAAFVASLFLF